MKSGRVDTMERWEKAKAYLSKHGYQLWQMQYGTDTPHGFQARFWSNDLPQIEIITFSNDVVEAIYRYSAEHKA